MKAVTQVQAATCRCAKSWSHPGQQVPFLFLLRKPGLELRQTFYRSSANIPTQKPEASNKDKSHITPVSDLTACCTNVHCPPLIFPVFTSQQWDHTFPWQPFSKLETSPEPCVCSCSPSTATSLQQSETVGTEEAHDLQSTMWNLQKQGTYLLSKKNFKSLLENKTKNHPYGFIKQFPISLLHRKHSEKAARSLWVKVLAEQCECIPPYRHCEDLLHFSILCLCLHRVLQTPNFSTAEIPGTFIFSLLTLM